jgi:SNF2 family DNA or RNA helicase
MKIEQRIGRLHRINFCLVGSLEEYILKILHEKINLFELVVGEIDTIVGNEFISYNSEAKKYGTL